MRIGVPKEIKYHDPERVQGDYLLGLLMPYVQRFRSVGDVRGKGLMIALDLVADKNSREPKDPSTGFAYRIAAAARRNGLMIRPYGSKIIASPPLIFKREHCDELAGALEKAFAEEDV